MLSSNNIPKPIPAYMLNDDEVETDYIQEYIHEEDNESVHSEFKEINNNMDYYKIFFMLPKKKRKEIIYNNEIKEEYLEKKRQKILEKHKYEANIKYFKIKNKIKLNKELIKLKVKQKEDSIVNNVDYFMWYYNNNLIQCKQPKCKNKCANDIGYCLEHYPKDQLFYKINENDKLSKLFSTTNFENLLTNIKIYDEMIKIGEKEGLFISDLRNKLTEPEYLSFISMKEEDINSFTKYDKSADLVNTFKDKIKYIKITDFRLRKWGTLQYNAFKDYLYDIIYKDDPEYNKFQNIFNNILEDVTELDTPYPVDEYKTCINCGTEGILPCKFST